MHIGDVAAWLARFDKKHLLSQPLGYIYKHMTQCVFCIANPQLLKFWEMLFETTEPHFLKLIII
jgi:hypothetical protein